MSFEPPVVWTPTPWDLRAFHIHLKALLKERTLSQNVVEHKAGLARGTLSKIFAGKLGVDRRHLAVVAQALGMTDQELAAGTTLEPLLAQALPTLESAALKAAHRRINQLEQELTELQVEVESGLMKEQQSGQFSGQAQPLLSLAILEDGPSGHDLQRRLRQMEDQLGGARRDYAAAQAQIKELKELTQQAQTREHEGRRLIAEIENDRSSLTGRLAEAQRAEQIARKVAEDLRAQVARLTRSLGEETKARESAEVHARASLSRAEKQQAIAAQARQQADEWAAQAAAETSRAEQLQKLVWQIQEKARAEAAAITEKLNQTRTDANAKVSPGNALLLALAGAGLGAALSSSSPKRRY